MQPKTRIHCRTTPHRAGGFTLLELVVVIAILAILATIAVRSIEGIEDQTRFDSTRTQLANIQSATVGNPSATPTDGSAQIFSFVSDNGRLPIAIGADPTTQLQELWANPNNLPPLAVRQATTIDPDVWIPTGWRGNYLQLGVGQTSLVDGWGNPYDLFFTSPAFSLASASGTPALGVLTPCGSGNPIEIVRSRGADGIVDAAPTTGFNADQSVIFNSISAFENSPATNTYEATITGTVFFYDSTTGQVEPANPNNGTIYVLLFSPGTDPTMNYIATQVATITTTTTGATTYTFMNIPPAQPIVTVGQRIIRAYQYATPPTLTTTGVVGIPLTGTLSSFRSIPVRLTVQPGQQVKDLTMLPPTPPATQPAPPATGN